MLKILKVPFKVLALTLVLSVSACSSGTPSTDGYEAADLTLLEPTMSDRSAACFALSSELEGPRDLATVDVKVPASVVSEILVTVRSNATLDTSVEMVATTATGPVALTLNASDTPTTVPIEVLPPHDATQVQVRFVQSRPAAPDTEWCFVGIKQADDEQRTPEGQEVMVNQLGYLPTADKHAVLRGAGSQAKSWELIEPGSAELGNEQTIASGNTQVLGTDPTTGWYLQGIDFSDVQEIGGPYVLRTEEVESQPFTIGEQIYRERIPELVGFLYGNRSGQEIVDAYSDGQARPAGHLQVPPNRGDVSVPCLPLGDPAQNNYDEPWSCEGTADVSGGWYDAGDYGKYTVPGAVAVAQLLRSVEMSDYWQADGNLPVPAQKNGVPDLLDEVRWQLEFMAKMQIPSSQPDAGMVYHKVTGTDWPSGSLLPDQDPTERVLYRPSSQATLAFAAAAAQASRMYEPYDSEFAGRMLTSSKRAFEAGRRQPDLHPPANVDNIDPNPGGGMYEDKKSSDELFWAATELFLTTGEERYASELSSLLGSMKLQAEAADFYWADMQGFAMLELATVDNDLPERQKIREFVVKAADNYVDMSRGNAWNVPYMPDGSIYDWGSNTVILSRVQMLAGAHAISDDEVYAQVAAGSLDYILGTNAFGSSFVTGWGEGAVDSPHSPLFKDQAEVQRQAPPGTLVGGPNTLAAGTGDQSAAEALQGCVGQTCYVDDSASWSTNEPTIYGNAALIAAVTFVEDWAAQQPQSEIAMTPVGTR